MAGYLEIAQTNVAFMNVNNDVISEPIWPMAIALVIGLIAYAVLLRLAVDARARRRRATEVHQRQAMTVSTRNAAGTEAGAEFVDAQMGRAFDGNAKAERRFQMWLATGSFAAGIAVAVAVIVVVGSLP